MLWHYHNPNRLFISKPAHRLWRGGQGVCCAMLLVMVLSCIDSHQLEEKVRAVTTPYSDHAFVMAIANQDDTLLEGFLADEVNPNAKNRFGDSALHWAVYRNRVALVDRLLDLGADPNQLGSYQMPAIMWACKRGHDHLIRRLLASGASIHVHDKWGDTALHHAVKTGHAAAVTILLEHGADPNAVNAEGETPIFTALRNADADIARLLIDRGAQLKLTSKSGVTPIELAVDAELTAILRKPSVAERHPWIAAELDVRMADVIENIDEKPEIDWHRLKRKIHDLMNVQRREFDLAPLTPDDRLAEIAQAHSQDMARQSFFSHVNPRGETPSDRARRFGFEARQETATGIREGIAENIFQGGIYSGSAYHLDKGIKMITRQWLTEDDLATQIVTGLMDSPGHRKNILGAQYTSQGLGLALDDEDRLYFTQNLW